MRLIDADELRKTMYHEAFETDTDMQRWDSGCWIRYKMFENALENVPTIEAEPVIRCKDCKWFDKKEDSSYGYCHAMKHGYYSSRWEISIYRTYKEDFYCADGEMDEVNDE